LEGLIGFFVNLVVIRSHVDGRAGLHDLLQQVRDNALAALEWQDIPFQMIVDDLKPERVPNRHPLFQVAFAFQNTPATALSLPGLTVSRVDDDQTARFDLEVFLNEHDGELSGSIAYDQRLFDPATVAAIAQHWQAAVGDQEAFGIHIQPAGAGVGLGTIQGLHREPTLTHHGHVQLAVGAVPWPRFVIVAQRGFHGVDAGAGAVAPHRPGWQRRLGRARDEGKNVAVQLIARGGRVRGDGGAVAGVVLVE
jgi:hypothetical protein